MGHQPAGMSLLFLTAIIFVLVDLECDNEKAKNRRDLQPICLNNNIQGHRGAPKVECLLVARATASV